MATLPPSAVATGKSRAAFASLLRAGAMLVCGLAAIFSLGGCVTPTSTNPEQAATSEPDVPTLKEGDVLKIAFPGAPGLDTTQPIRQDGRITLPVIGDLTAVGKTTDGLSKELLDLFADQLVSKEISVTLVSSTYTLYVTGAVLRPGKVVTDRRVSVFDAIMEAGGFDRARANLKAVQIVRVENGQSRTYIVNLQQVLDGGQAAPFYLKAFDSVIVPEKITWF